MGRILFTPHRNLTPPIFPVKYGLLYNGKVPEDVRLLANTGWIVPESGNYNTLITYLGGSSVAGGKLKELGFVNWQTPNNGATNLVNFNARGAGFRNGTTVPLGGFIGLTQYLFLQTKTAGTSGVVAFYLTYNSATIASNNTYTYQNGFSVRLMRPATTAEQLLADGTTCDPYIQNDGKLLPTVKIGTQVWLADNLAETKYRNGDWIHGFDGGVYTPISNEDWAALTTGALCAYDNDWNNV